LSPFFDYGAGWNNDGGTASPRSISSVGVGVAASYGKHLHFRLDWGIPLDDLDRDYDDAQDYGIHFSIRAAAF
jgi:hemolysin activation/secretion protein